MSILHTCRGCIRTYGVLIARVIVSTLFLTAGLGKIGSGLGLGVGFAEFVSTLSLAGLPVPGLFALLIVCLEVGGGLGLLLGWYFAESAAALIVVSVLAALFFYNAQDALNHELFLRNLSVVSVLLYMYVYGPGSVWTIQKST